MTGLDGLILALDPAALMRATGREPDPWQAAVLRSTADRLLLLCFRQAGKSTTTAALALHAALFEPGSLVLLVSPTLRQSGELYRKVCDAYRALGRPVASVEDSATTLALANGSRVVSLPGSPATIRGYSSPRLVVVDEAAQVDELMMPAVAPMLSGGGRLLLLSTPFGRRGFFHEAWHDAAGPWHRVKATAEDCPRIAPAFLAEQRQVLGPRWYDQEFLCEFVESVGQVFATDAVLGAFDSAEAPLFGG